MSIKSILSMVLFSFRVSLLLCLDALSVEESGPKRKRKERKRGEMAQTMYTHVSKCKNHEIKNKNKRRQWGVKICNYCFWSHLLL
jgi:hypothetical protein